MPSKDTHKRFNEQDTPVVKELGRGFEVNKIDFCSSGEMTARYDSISVLSVNGLMLLDIVPIRAVARVGTNPVSVRYPRQLGLPTAYYFSSLFVLDIYPVLG